MKTKHKTKYRGKAPILATGDKEAVIEYLRQSFEYLNSNSPLYESGAERVDEYNNDLSQLIDFYHKTDMEPYSKGKHQITIKTGSDTIKLGAIHSKRMIEAYYKYLIITHQIEPKPTVGTSPEAYVQIEIEGIEGIEGHVYSVLERPSVTSPEPYIQQRKAASKVNTGGRPAKWYTEERNKVIRTIKQQYTGTTLQIWKLFDDAGWPEEEMPSPESIRRIKTD